MPDSNTTPPWDDCPDQRPEVVGDRYAVVGKPFAKVRRDGRKVRVAKRAHLIRNGRSVCKVENAFRRRQPNYQFVIPGEHEVCKLCLIQSGAVVEIAEPQYAETRLSVLLGERVR